MHFVRDTEVAVPDLAGWKRERMPMPPEDQRFDVVPDWVCEILSPSTESRDRRIKMPLCAHYGVALGWLVDPSQRTLEAVQLRSGSWHQIGRVSDTDRAAISPFDAITLDLASLWLPTPGSIAESDGAAGYD
ncbi:Uma2 family endonuclease [Thiorhodococcus minor]|uniref:Uma2 family endonuclease n=1 Tax=Thiorhodococcus minor TaxID=57489 RepID=UPI0031596766